MSELKPGYFLWVRSEVTGEMANGKLVINTLEGECIRDHPALPAVARWLSSQPDWVVYAESIARLVRVSELCSAMLALHGQIDPHGDFYRELVTALDSEMLPHDWEALRSLAAALAGEGSGE